MNENENNINTGVATASRMECGLCGKILRSEDVARVVHGRAYCEVCVESDDFFQVLAQEHGKDVEHLRGKIKPPKPKRKKMIMLIVETVIIFAGVIYFLFFMPSLPNGRHLAYQGNVTKPTSSLEECIENMWKIRAAITAYHKKTGTYPESLELLVPEYLDKVPVCPSSQLPYEYYRTKDDCCWQCPRPHEHGVDSVECDSLGGPPMVHQESSVQEDEG